MSGPGATRPRRAGDNGGNTNVERYAVPRCPYCRNEFPRSPTHPRQKVCLRDECQRRRRREYHRQKQATDPDYAAGCRDSQQAWRAGHPDYQRQYRASHPAAAERNRQRQRTRDALKRARRAVPEAAAAVTAQQVAGPVVLVWPGRGNLDKNNLAFARLIAFGGGPRPGGGLDKNNLAPGYPEDKKRDGGGKKRRAAS